MFASISMIKYVLKHIDIDDPIEIDIIHLIPLAHNMQMYRYMVHIYIYI